MYPNNIIKLTKIRLSISREKDEVSFEESLLDIERKRCNTIASPSTKETDISSVSS